MEALNFTLYFGADKCLNAPGSAPICEAVPGGLDGVKISVALDNCTALTMTKTLCDGQYKKQLMQDGYTYNLLIHLDRVVEAGVSNPTGAEIMIQIQDASGTALDTRAVNMQYQNGVVTDELSMSSSTIYAGNGISHTSGVVLGP